MAAASLGYIVCFTLLLWANAESTLVVEAQHEQVVNKVSSNTSLIYNIRPWPPCCQQEVTLTLVSPTNQQLCQPRWTQGRFVESSAACSLNDPRVQDYTAFLNTGVRFVLHNVTLQDQGDYTLQVAMDTETASAALNLVVHAPPPLPSLHADKPCEEAINACAVGDVIRVTCTVRNANPPADLEWTRINTPIYPTPEDYKIAGSWQDQSVSTISVGPLRSIDHGVTYACRAFNGIGQATSAFVPIVKFAPSVSVLPCAVGANYSLLEHDDAKFKCSVNANPDANYIAWQSPPDVATREDVNASTLTVLDTKRGYSGYYTCSAGNDLGTSSGECVLNVIYGAEIDLPKESSAVSGNRLRVHCQYSANPPPEEVYWTKENNATFRMEGDFLDIASIQPKDVGNYLCHVTNILHPSGGKKTSSNASAKVTVVVEYSPIWVEFALKAFTGLIGSSASLDCSSQAVPQPEYTWFRDGHSLQEGDGLRFVTSTYGISLVLDNVKNDDFGDYLCVVVNDHGRKEYTLALLPPGRPDGPQQCSVVSTEARQVSIKCVLGYQGGATVNLEVLGEKSTSNSPSAYSGVNQSGETQLMVTDLDPSTDYTLHVYSSNKYGRSDSSQSLQVRTLVAPPTPASPPADVGILVAGIIGAIAFSALLLVLIFAIHTWGIPPIPQKYKDMRAKNKAEARMLREAVKKMREEVSETEDDNSDEDADEGIEMHESGEQNKAFEADYSLDIRDGNDRQQTTYAFAPGKQSKGKGQIYPDEDERVRQASPARLPGIAGTQQRDGILKPTSSRTSHVLPMIANPLDSSTPKMSQRPASIQNGRPASMTSPWSPSELTARVPCSGMLSSIDTPYESPRLVRSSVSNSPRPARSKVTDWEVHRDELHFVELVGSGQFSEVWRAFMTARQGRRQTVAVKIMKADCPSSEVDEFLRDLEVMETIKSHPNIIQLQACCSTQEPVYMILEFASNGSLRDWVRTYRFRSPYHERHFDTRDVVVYALQVANGMAYLASLGMLHRDLAARSVLLDSSLTCKLSDFGTAREVASSRQQEAYIRSQPLRWLAPESLFDNIFSVKSDVWAFGILLQEVLTLGGTPYGDLSSAEVMDFLTCGRRLDMPTKCIPAMYRLMCSCWHADPNQRPQFLMLRQRLEAMLDSLDQEPCRNMPIWPEDVSHNVIIEALSGEKC